MSEPWAAEPPSPEAVHEAAVDLLVRHGVLTRSGRALVDGSGVVHRVVGRLAREGTQSRRVGLGTARPTTPAFVVLFGRGLGEVIVVRHFDLDALGAIAKHDSYGRWWFRLTKGIDDVPGVTRVSLDAALSRSAVAPPSVASARLGTARWTEASLLRDIADAAGLAIAGPVTVRTADRLITQLVLARGGSLPDLPGQGERVTWLLGPASDPAGDVAPDGRATTAGLRQLRRVVRGEPYAFIVNVADNEASREYEDVLGESFGFDSQVSGSRALIEAGAGSRLLFYGTRNARAVPRMAFFADGAVERIELLREEAGKAVYRAAVSGFRWFPRDVRPGDVPIDWNHQHGIAEITFGTYVDVARRATGTAPEADPLARAHGRSRRPARARALPRVDAPVPGSLSIHVPDELPDPTATSDPLTVPAPVAASDGSEPPDQARTPREREHDAIAEGRAIHIARELLERDGWTFVADRQRDRVGYDLEFSKGERPLHVEVKGIQGARLRFGMTGREWRRASEDPDFVVLAVTDVLGPRPAPILVTRDRLSRATAVVTQLRVDLTTG